MNTLQESIAYIPIDRRFSWQQGEKLSPTAAGTVLFADISGFTPLTKTLSEELGPRRGTEELTRQINLVYDVLISRIHKYGGSVLGFAGDSITCWFGDDAGDNAVTAAFDMQQAMNQFSLIITAANNVISLSIKVSIATGIVRRFAVGDAKHQLIDVIAGSTLDRMSLAEKVAEPGEIVVDQSVIDALGDTLEIAEQRIYEGEPFFVISNLATHAEPKPWPEIDIPEGHLDEVPCWLLPPVHQRLQTGQGQFLAELRPTACIFISFGGLDYDHDDDVGPKLDKYIHWMQSILGRYEGLLLQLTTGDKGSYAYAVFGAPISHEDNIDRALAAALELHQQPFDLSYISDVRVGISHGMSRTGAYGSDTRRTYGVLGDETNTAARLMGHAKPGQILVTQHALEKAEASYRTESLGGVQFKGKPEPIVVHELLGFEGKTAVLHPIPEAALIGRDAEVEKLLARLHQLQTDLQKRVVIVEGEAGIGKSYLISNVLQQTDQDVIQTFVGSGDAIEKSTAYFAWESLLLSMFGVVDTGDHAVLQADVSQQLAKLGFEFVERAPLLNGVFGFEIPESALTSSMEGRVRADNTRELLVQIVKRMLDSVPAFLVIDDAHWLDSASWALLLKVAHEVESLLICVLTRPMSETEAPSEYGQLQQEPHAELITLSTLSQPEIVSLIEDRLGVDKLPQPMIDFVMEKAEGHPFFSEELAYALRDTGLIEIEDGVCKLAQGVADLTAVNFPDTVQGVIRSRLDRLQPQQQLVMKVASIIGRVYAVSMLRDVHPISEDKPHIEDHLQALEGLDLSILEVPPPDLTYIFKHIITQEVAYNLMTFAQRQQLHYVVAEWYESQHAGELNLFYPVLAHHWSRAEHRDKAIEFLSKAGKQALDNFANKEAIQFLSQAMELVAANGDAANGVDRFEVIERHFYLGEAYYRIGRLVECEEQFGKALTMLGYSLPGNTVSLVGNLAGQLVRQLGYRKLPAIFKPDTNLTPEQRREISLAYEVYERLLEVSYLSSDTTLTVVCTLNSLNLSERLGRSPQLANAYATFAMAAGIIPAHGIANAYKNLAEQTLQDGDDVRFQAEVLWSYAVYLCGIGAWEESEQAINRALAIFERLGNWDRWGICMELLARNAYNQNQYEQAEELVDKLYETAVSKDDFVQQSWAVNGKMQTALRYFRPQEAIEWSKSALGVSEQSQEVGSAMKTYSLLAVSHIQAEQWQEAQAAADKALELISSAQPTSFGSLGAYAACANAQLALLEHGKTKPVEELKANAEAGMNAFKSFQRVFPIGVPRYLTYRAWMARLNGKTAAGELRQAISLADEKRMPYDVGLAHAELSRHLTASDPAYDLHVSQASEIFERLGNAYELHLLWNNE